MALNSLGIQIEHHWREHRPKMVKDLESTGQLQAALETAEEKTLTAEIEAIRGGMTPDQARELYRETWAFLPPEDDASVDSLSDEELASRIIAEVEGARSTAATTAPSALTPDRLAEEVERMKAALLENVGAGRQFPPGKMDDED